MSRPWIDFEDVHRRYWRDHRRDSDAMIPIKGGDIVERDGRHYAVLFDREGNVVAVYQLAAITFRLLKAVGRLAAEVGEIAKKQRQG